MNVHVSRGSLFRSEIFHMIDLCIVHSEAGGGPLTKFTRSEDRLTTDMHAARLTASLNHSLLTFFSPLKRDPRGTLSQYGL
jgi:hypothetical protein